MKNFSVYLKQTPFWGLSAVKCSLYFYFIYLNFLSNPAYSFQDVTVRHFFSGEFLEIFKDFLYLILSLIFTVKLRRKYLWGTTLFVAFECGCFLFEWYAWQKGGLHCYDMLLSGVPLSVIGG